MTGLAAGAQFPVNAPYRMLKRAGKPGNEGHRYPADPVTERARELISDVVAFIDGQRLVAEVETHLGDPGE